MPELTSVQPVPTKQCYACKVFKTLDNFSTVWNRHRSRQKLYAYCYDCISKKSKAKRALNPDYKPKPLPPPAGFSRCGSCKELKPLDQFHKNKARSVGVGVYCVDCTKVKHLDKYLKHTYNMSEDEYNAILESQDGVCAICKKPESVIHFGKALRLSVDHCHTTGNNRGLLCYGCNHLVGYLDRVGKDMVDAAFAYITLHS